MSEHRWVKHFPGAVTVCDTRGVIIQMNEAAIQLFQEEGGEKLIGSSLLNCHPEPALSKLKKLMESQQKNVYTIQKKGKKKLIFQTPWYEEGKYAGFMELSLEIPWELPHFNRDS